VSAPFVFEPPALDAETGVARLAYRGPDGTRFVERFEFGPPPPDLGPARRALAQRLVVYLHGLCGVSYYKAHAAHGLDLAATELDADAAAFLHEVYLHGLGEFAHVNGLDLAPRLVFTGTDGHAPLTALPAALHRRALVPVGGGKDSLVTVETLIHAGEPFALFAVNPKGPIAATLAASDGAAVTVRRTLDPALLRLNAEGALNGHVPITAIVTVAALVAAAWHGYDHVVMSNERSADAGNLDADGRAVNHQWSKSSAFEGRLRAELRRAVSPDLDVFSLLRPLSELAIAERFARSFRWDAVFSSCNRNFHLTGDGPAGRWCRDCPKCRFVFLALAPFVRRERLLAMFGGDVLDDPAQIEGFRELAGLAGHKPFECVGETGEAAAALALLSLRWPWSETAVVKALEPELAPRRGELLRYLAEARRAGPAPFVPPALYEAVAA
jgi:UDP-N-acetyl-alpha-D-muramoyl-L-alanyl-L-glutamate epimerase